MIEWQSRSRLQPYAHQNVGTEFLVSKLYALLADEMGGGKTKQAIDAAQILAFLLNKIARVIVVTPASVRGVWFHPELGELARHLWQGYPSHVMEFHEKQREWKWCKKDNRALLWIVTNYDYIRRENHLKDLLSVADEKTLLILDESSAVKKHNSLQTRASLKLRRKCGRVWLLNGTPIANSPIDMYSQGLIMSPTILDLRGVTHFRSRYAVMGGYVAETRFGKIPTQVIKWVNLDDLQQRFAPFTLRRLKKDCMDLPEKLPPVTIPVPLTKPTWSVYQQMSKDMVAWLESGMATADAAMIKIMRLAQIASGFIGGVETLEEGEATAQPAWLDQYSDGVPETLKPQKEVTTLGSEKINAFIQWLTERLEEDPMFKVLVWCRFRFEVDRLYEILSSWKTLTIGKIIGGQKQTERDHALRILDPRVCPAGPVVVVGTPSSGSMGLNLTAASCVVYLSNDYSLKTRMQSEDRVHRPGQTRAVSYFDFMAVGPNGQKTIDADILKALRSKEDLANWTTAAWIRALNVEDEDNGPS